MAGPTRKPGPGPWRFGLRKTGDIEQSGGPGTPVASSWSQWWWTHGRQYNEAIAQDAQNVSAEQFFRPVPAPPPTPPITAILSYPQEYREDNYSRLTQPPITPASQNQQIRPIFVPPQEYREDWWSRTWRPLQSQQQLLRSIYGAPQDYREDFWSRAWSPTPLPRVPWGQIQTLPQEQLDQRWSVVFTPIPTPAAAPQSAPPVFAQSFPEQWPITSLSYSAIYQPLQVPPPTPPVIPPAGGGGGPGKLPGKRKKKDGPYMRDGQVFGEEYAVSPHGARDARGRFVKGMKAKLEMVPQESDTPPAWSIILDTTFTDLDE